MKINLTLEATAGTMSRKLRAQIQTEADDAITITVKDDMSKIYIQPLPVYELNAQDMRPEINYDNILKSQGGDLGFPPVGGSAVCKS